MTFTYVEEEVKAIC